MAQTADTNFENVNFSASQQAILDADIARINKAIDDIAAWKQKLAGYQADYNYQNDRINNIEGNCVGLPHAQYVSCTHEAEVLRAAAGSNAQNADNQAKAITASLNDPTNGYIAAYNSDLKQIQNQIKLQIQQQQANLNANTTVNQNTPQVILAQQQATLQSQQASLNARNASRATTLKYGAAVLITIVIVWAGIKLLKNV